jgi:hypothetical protein
MFKFTNSVKVRNYTDPKFLQISAFYMVILCILGQDLTKKNRTF